MKSSTTFRILLLLSLFLTSTTVWGWGITGIWNWADGQTTIILPNGNYVIRGETRGTYTDHGGNTYKLVTESGFTDELTLSNNGNLLTGIGYRNSRPAKTWKMKCKRMTGDQICGSRTGSNNTNANFS